MRIESAIDNPQFNPQSTISNRQSSMSHILVVEDDGDIAELIGHFLEKAGHRVDRLT